MLNLESVPRQEHDLSTYVATCGEIGRLMTLQRHLVLPGDGFEMDLIGAINLSPLRRGLTLDSRVDIVSFFVPHRFIYGDDWVDFIEDGVDETVTFSTESSPATSGGNMPALAARANNSSQAVPLHIPEGYRMIYNRWYRPTTTVPEYTTTLNSWTQDEYLWGLACARLPNYWSQLLNDIPASSAYTVASATSFDLLDLKTQLGELRTREERDFFNTRYDDIIKSFGGNTEFSASDRPDMFGKTTFWASGYDVDGTTEQSLGTFSGRVKQSFRHRIPRFYCREHGTIWTMALLRFPTLNINEHNYMDKKPQFTYAEMAGDPDLVQAQPPMEYRLADTFVGGDSTVRGYVPYAQWYRTQAPTIHQRYQTVQGFPFEPNAPTDTNSLVLCVPANWDAMFENTALGHWNMQAKSNVRVMRRFPTPRQTMLT